MTISRWLKMVIGCCAFIGLWLGQPRSTQAAELELAEGDRVVLLGATFIERMQAFGYLETILTSRYPHRNITFRNLGWSADTVGGISRAVFGAPEDGFQRMLKDMATAKPTVIVVAYGANEAYGGTSGLPQFEVGLNRLLDELGRFKARIVLISPPDREYLGPPLPDPRKYNESLKEYLAVVSKVASTRRLPYCELAPVVPNSKHRPVEAPLDRLTDNGLHRTPYGHWRAAPVMAAGLGHAAIPWRIDIDVSRGVYEAQGTSISAVQLSDESIVLSAVDSMLPSAPAPRHAPDGTRRLGPSRVMRVRGMAPGVYELRVDGEVAARASQQVWADGVTLRRGPQFDQAEHLREAITLKNELFFHRHRPQNETYLFLFRKHEQGNNAAEVAQFAPLIKQQEQRIAKLRQPRTARFELNRIP